MPRSSKTARILALAPLCLLAGFLYWMAVTIRLDTFDTYEIFLNARLISGDATAAHYYATRAFVFPTLLSPVFLISRLVAADPPVFALAACHVLSVTVTCLFAWSCYLLLRTHLSRALSWLGAALLLLNPLIVHTSPVSKEDQPGALFTTLAVLFYLRLRRDNRAKNLVLTALFTFLTIGTRYNLLPLLPAVFAAHELLADGLPVDWRRFGKRAAALGVAPVALWLLVPTLIYAAIGRAPLLEAPSTFIGELYHATVGAVGSEMPYAEPATDALEFIFWALSPAVSALAAWGIFSAWRSRAPGRLIHSLWLGIFLAFHALVLGHHEARYFFPLYGPLYYFAAVGAEAALGHLRAPAVKAAFLALLLSWPVYRGLDECRKFFEPFYHENFAKAVADEASALSAKDPIIWLGPFYAIHPREYVFHPHDPVTYLYHVFSHTIRYYTRRPVVGVQHRIPATIPGRAPKNGVFPLPAVAIGLEDGQSVILNAAANPFTTYDVPETLNPLVVERAVVRELAPTRGDASRFRASADPALALSARLTGDALAVTLEGSPGRAWLVYARSGDAGMTYLGLFDPFEGTRELRTGLDKLPGGRAPTSYRIISFDSVTLMRTE